MMWLPRFVKENLSKAWLESAKGELIARYQAELAGFESSVQQDLDSKRLELQRLQREASDELAFLQKRVEDRQTELARQNDDLKTQIRLIEAKASPDSIWISAFTAGFNKAWDMMEPLLTEGVFRAKKSIQDQAIQDTLSRLGDVIENRAREIADGNALHTG